MKSQFPVGAYLKRSDLNHFRVSPDGTQVSFIRSIDDSQCLFVKKVFAPSKAAVEIVKLDGSNVTEYFWINSDVIAYTVDDIGDEQTALKLIDITSRCHKELGLPRGARIRILDPLRRDEEHVLLLVNQRDQRAHDVYRLNIFSGRLQEVARNPGGIVRWLSDCTGAVRLGLEMRGGSVIFKYRESQFGEFVDSFRSNRRIKPLRFSQSGSSIFALSDAERDKLALVEIDLRTGSEIAEVARNEKYDIDDALFCPFDGTPVAFVYTDHKVRIEHIQKRSREQNAEMSRQIGEESFLVMDQSVDGKIQVLSVSSEVQPGRFYIYETGTGKFEFTDLAPQFKDGDLRPVQCATVVARDGLVLDTYVTLPSSRSHERMPAVIVPHGGPWIRDRCTYNGVTQFLASRGYAVLQVNYRGSTGYGNAFWKKGFKQWGRAMQDDVVDAVEWFAGTYPIAKDRIGILGSSYGGYVALAALSFTPNLFACGVSIMGISNVSSFLKNLPSYWAPQRQMLYKLIGDPILDAELLRQISPIHHADKITAPIFLVHGANDVRIHKDESERMISALRSRGAIAEYFCVPNEGHGIAHPENRIEIFQRVERFLDEHLHRSTSSIPFSSATSR